MKTLGQRLCNIYSERVGVDFDKSILGKSEPLVNKLNVEDFRGDEISNSVPTGDGYNGSRVVWR
jgi:hypothetical protein